MTMDLAENSTILEFQLAQYKQLSHPVADGLLLEINEVRGQVFKRMLDTLSALLKHLHLVHTVLVDIVHILMALEIT